MIKHTIQGNEILIEIPKDYKGKILHIRVGDDNWEPSIAELDKVTDLFFAALSDEEGGIVTTHKSVVATVLNL